MEEYYSIPKTSILCLLLCILGSSGCTTVSGAARKSADMCKMQSPPQDHAICEAGGLAESHAVNAATPGYASKHLERVQNCYYQKKNAVYPRDYYLCKVRATQELDALGIRPNPESTASDIFKGILGGTLALGSVMVGIAEDAGAGAAQLSTTRFPNDIEYVNGPGLEANRYYKPLGCVIWTPREKPAGYYDTQNNCRYGVDVYYKQGTYQPDYVYGGAPSNSIRAGNAGGISVKSDRLGSLIACLKADSLLKRRRGDVEGVPDYEGHICRRRGPVTDPGRGQTAQ